LLLLEIVCRGQILSNEKYRKESSFSKENFLLPPELSLPPTILRPRIIQKVEDYGLEEKTAT